MSDYSVFDKLIGHDLIQTEVPEYIESRNREGLKLQIQERRSKNTKRNISRKILNERDFEVLRLCYVQGFMTRNQVMTWLMQNYPITNTASGNAVTHKIVTFLVSESLVEKIRSPFLNSGEIIIPTLKGVKILRDRGLVPDYCAFSPVDDAKLYHDFMATNVRLLLERFPGIYNWQTDKEFRSCEFSTLPDAIAVFDTEKAVSQKLALEFELSQKSSSRYNKKFIEYQNSDYSVVIYFVSSKKLGETVLESSHEVSGKIFICELDDLLTNKDHAYIKSNREEFE